MKPLSLVHRHCHRHLSDTFHALIHHLDTIEHTLLLVAIGIGFSANALFAGTSSTIPKEISELIYPVKKVSTLPCRQQIKHWDELDESCKVDLPRIEGANYDYYRDRDAYSKTPFDTIYSVLWGATYKGQRDMEKGDHAGVDISTARGTPLYAVGHGIVTFAGWQAGYGNVVKLMFRYQGVTYHAVYGHMDEIMVKKGDTLIQGQQLGTVGNSGSTYGALGGYHVHFEINKDFKGSSLFYYAGCPALVEDKKSFTDITNNGLCREYREKAQVDPIAFIEASKGKRVASLTPITSVSKSESKTTASVVIPQFITLKKLDTTKLSKEAIMFVRERDIQLVGTYASKMKLGESGTLQVFVTQKGTAKKFQGTLPAGFSLISPTNGIKTSASSINYLDNGQYELNITPSKAGIHKLAVSLGGQTIAVIEIDITI